ETPAARQLQLRANAPFEPELLLVLVDVEVQLHRRHDSVGVSGLGNVAGLERSRKMPQRLAISGESEVHWPSRARGATFGHGQLARGRAAFRAARLPLTKILRKADRQLY